MIERFTRPIAEPILRMFDKLSPKTKAVDFKAIFLGPLSQVPFGSIITREIDFGNALGGKIKINAHFEMDEDEKVIVLNGVPGYKGPMTMYLSS